MIIMMMMMMMMMINIFTSFHKAEALAAQVRLSFLSAIMSQVK